MIFEMKKELSEKLSRLRNEDADRNNYNHITLLDNRTNNGRLQICFAFVRVYALDITNDYEYFDRNSTSRPKKVLFTIPAFWLGCELEFKLEYLFGLLLEFYKENGFLTDDEKNQLEGEGYGDGSDGGHIPPELPCPRPPHPPHPPKPPSKPGGLVPENDPPHHHPHHPPHPPLPPNIL